MEIINTHTGKIFVDKDRKLEFLTVGDYGKENNIKADFLGLTKEIHGVQHKEVDLSDKWVATISTQKGCSMHCEFCDCPKFGFYGNATLSDLIYEIETILKETPDVKHTNRFNVHFARMGEPTFNSDVLEFTKHHLRNIVNTYITADTIHPVVSTMLPKGNKNLKEFIQEWCRIKNEEYNGEAGLQFSINSTDDNQRNKAFNGMSLSLQEISDLAKSLPDPKGRKYTLNFAVTKDTILDANKLDSLFDKDKWIVKITPIHETHSAIENGYDTGDTYTDYDVYKVFEEPLIALGWDVIVFVPSKEEDSDRITCGNAIISNNGDISEEEHNNYVVEETQVSRRISYGDGYNGIVYQFRDEISYEDFITFLNSNGVAIDRLIGYNWYEDHDLITKTPIQNDQRISCDHKPGKPGEKSKIWTHLHVKPYTD